MLKGCGVLKVRYKQDDNTAELTVTIQYQGETAELETLRRTLNLVEHQITGHRDGRSFPLSLSAVYTFESMDERVLCITKDSMYDTSYRLYELLDLLPYPIFIRANKSTIVNIKKIKDFKVILSGRIEANLINGDKVLISRIYAKTLKEALKAMEGDHHAP